MATLRKLFLVYLHIVSVVEMTPLHGKVENVRRFSLAKENIRFLVAFRAFYRVLSEAHQINL